MEILLEDIPCLDGTLVFQRMFIELKVAVSTLIPLKGLPLYEFFSGDSPREAHISIHWTVPLGGWALFPGHSPGGTSLGRSRELVAFEFSDGINHPYGWLHSFTIHRKKMSVEIHQ